ncbi:MAG: gliding motility-associated C-terminal domain-containing protein, partial [Bacteroidales bacterium]|nr:gliding motility-associated C-terminal domain-containing protein [Bacteroidales bacterium]
GIVRFDDGSTGATTCYLDYGTGQDSQEQTPSFKYEVPGTYNVVLTATDDFGCSTSDTVIVIVHEGLEVWIPDAFSPNGDGLNDLFGPVARGMSLEGYEMVIIDRWGKEAFYTNDYFHRWDGTINGTKVEMNTVFIYRIKLRDIMGKEYGYSGRVSLIYGFE